TCRQTRYVLEPYIYSFLYHRSLPGSDRSPLLLERNRVQHGTPGPDPASPGLILQLATALMRRCSLIRWSTTAGSAKVDRSPSPSYSAAAILRRMRRMIFPERVFGRPLVQ